MGRRLPRGAHHEPAPHLVPDLPQGVQAVHPVLPGQLLWVEGGVVGPVRRLVAEEIPVRPGVKQPPVACPAPLPQGEGHGAVGPPFLHGPDEGAENVVGIVPVLPSLEHKGPEAQGVALGAAGQDVLGGEAVAVGGPVAPADAAVIAVVFAEVADLDEAPGEDLVPVPPPPLRHGQLRQAGRGLRGAGLDQLGVLLRGEGARRRQLADEGVQALIHGRPPRWRRRS